MVEKVQSKRALLIAGPTASGKSAVALDLAERFDGVIINADAMQVYRELKILSARPGPADMCRAPHRLYGSVAASERYSVGRWLDDAADALQAIWGRGQLPIVVGGTGLYFKALEGGLANMPTISEQVRARVAELASSEINLEHHLRVLTGEIVVDRQRQIRALEIFEETGRRLSDWQSDNGLNPLADVAVVKSYLLPERDRLYAACEHRFDTMVETGALEEVRQLNALGLQDDLPAMKAIGVREFSAHLAGDLSLEDAVTNAKTQTRRYAKRQLTWYRGQMQNWPALVPDTAASELSTQLERLIGTA